tara:strand:+ start:405 stop:3677 length:3273 start_codon:yes stop_codon:yes gene_type:complete
MAIDGGIYGFEQIPNVYINSIELHEKKPGSTKEGLIVKVEFLYYDTMNEYDEDLFTSKYTLDSMKLNTLLSLDSNLTNEIVNGNNLIHKPRSRLLKRFLDDELCILDNKETAKVFNQDIEKCVYDEYTEFYYTKTFHLKETPQHLSITCLFSDSDYRNRTSFGPTTCETIIENGKVVLSSKFLLNNEEIWTGPVHEHDGVIMAHSFHSNSIPHPTLTSVGYHNLKIKDFRSQRINLPDVKKENKQSNSKVIYSNLFYNQMSNHELGMVFSANIKSILLQNCKEAIILQETSPEVFNKLAQNLKIKSIKIGIKEHPRKPFRNVFYSFDQNEKVKTIQNKLGEMKEIVLSSNPFIRTFDIMLKTKRIHEMNVFIEVNNPLTKYLEDIYENFSKNITDLKISLQYFKKEMFYDRETGKLDRERVVTEFDNQNSTWISSIAQILKIRSLFLREDNEESVQEFVIKSMSKISARSFTVESLESFIDDCYYYLKLFVSIFEIKKKSLPSSFGRGKRSGNKNHKDELISSKRYRIKYKYRGKTKSYFKDSQDVGVKSFTVSSFMSLVQDEKNKLAGDFANDIINISNYNEYITLSPRLLISGGDKFSFNSLKTIQEDKISVFVDSLQISEEELSNLFGKNIKVEFLEEEKDLNFENLNLGTDNNFGTQTVTTDESLAPDRTKAIKDSVVLVGNKNSKKTKKIVDKVSPKTDSSIYSTGQEEGFNEASDVPIHYVFLANLNVSNKVFGSTMDFLRDKRYTRDLAFFNLERVYYEEYDLFDDSGDPIVGLGKIKPLTMSVLNNLEEPIICTLNSYHDPDFNIDNNQFERFETIDRNFIIYPNNFSFSKQQLSTTTGEDALEFKELYDAYYSLDVQELQFSRTNIVKESLTRKNNRYEKGLRVNINRFNNMDRQRARYFNKLKQEKRRKIIKEERRQRRLQADRRKANKLRRMKQEQEEAERKMMLMKMLENEKKQNKQIDISKFKPMKPLRTFPAISSGIVTKKLEKADPELENLAMELEDEIETTTIIPDKVVPPLPIAAPLEPVRPTTSRPPSRPPSPSTSRPSSANTLRPSANRPSNNRGGGRGGGRSGGSRGGGY